MSKTGLDEAFVVEFFRSSLTAVVPGDQSILDIAEELGIDAPYSCRLGSCGTCETRILLGRADHRDSVLSFEEREQNNSMMICVSRNASDSAKLVLDL